MDQDIVRLDISMCDAVTVKISQSAKKLGGKCFNFEFFKSSCLRNESAQVAIAHKFHNDKDAVFPVDMLNKLDDMWLLFVSLCF